MARIPFLASPGPLQSGDQSLVRFVPQPNPTGGAAIAQGMQSLGDGLAKLTEHVQAARDSTVLNNLGIAINEQTLDFEKWKQKTPDESQWIPQAEERISKLKDQFANEKLSPEGKLRFTAAMSDFQTRALMRVQLDSFRQAGENAITSATTLSKQRAAAGDIEGAKNAYLSLPDPIMHPAMKEAAAQGAETAATSTVRQQVATQLENFNRSGDFQGAQLLLDDPKTKEAFKDAQPDYERLVGVTEQEKGIRAVNTDILDNPAEALKKLDEMEPDGKNKHYPMLSPGAITNLKRTAAGQIQFNETLDKKTIVDDFSAGLLHSGVAKGKTGVPFRPVDLKADPTANWPEASKAAYAKLSPSGKQEINRFVAMGPQNDPLEFTGMQTKIAALDMRDKLKVADLATSIDMGFDGEYNKRLKETLDKREKATDESEKTPRSIADLFQEVDDDTKSGLHGNFHFPGNLLVIGKDGIPMRKVTDQTGKDLNKLVPVEISEADKLKWGEVAGDKDKQAKLDLEDLTTKREASLKSAAYKAALERLPKEMTVEEKRLKYYEMSNSDKLKAARERFQSTSQNPLLAPTVNPEHIDLSSKLNSILDLHAPNR